MSSTESSTVHSSHPQGRPPFTEDRWLAQILEREVYRLHLEPEPTTPLDAYTKEWSQRPVFAYGKVPTNSLSMVKLLEDAGFRLMDTRLALDKPLSKGRPPSGACRVRFASGQDSGAVVDLARRSFVYSRFHLDPDIPKDLADRLKGEWVRSFFTGARGDHMVVAEVNGRVAGFLELLKGEKETLIIDLIAVDPEARGKGLGADMIAFAENELTGYVRVLVGTQVSNIPSLRLYEKLGFRSCQSEYIFHYHSAAGKK